MKNDSIFQVWNFCTSFEVVKRIQVCSCMYMHFVCVAAREAESCLEWAGGQADGCVLGQMHHFNPRKQVQFQWVFLPHQLRATVYGDQQPHPAPLPESATMKDLGVSYLLNAILPPSRSRDSLLLLLWYQQHYEKHFCVHQDFSWYTSALIFQAEI